MDDNNQSGGPTIVVIFLTILFVALVAFTEYVDRNYSQEIKATSKCIRKSDCMSWGEQRALTEEWLEKLRGGNDGQ